MSISYILLPAWKNVTWTDTALSHVERQTIRLEIPLSEAKDWVLSSSSETARLSVYYTELVVCLSVVFCLVYRNKSKTIFS